MERVLLFVHRAGVIIRTRAHLYIGVAFFLGSFLLYARTMPPTVLDGDSGEYQYMAYILGVPHSSGYPLYILIAKLFTFLPIGDVAYRVNLFSVVAAALAAPIIFWIARRLNLQRGPAILATSIFLVTPSMWGGALEAKTYALHVLLGVLTIFLALRWHQEKSPRDFYAAAFVFGLGLANHHIIVFIAPALALFVWFNRALLNRSMIARGAILMMLPLLLYAYIPIRANQLIAQQDPANWALYQREDAMLKGTVSAYYNNTPQGFLLLVTGLDNYFKIGFLSDAEQSSRFSNAANLLLEQFTVVGVALAILGGYVSFRRDRRVFAFLAAIVIGISFVAIALRALSTAYYFSLTYLALAMWIGFGIDSLLSLRGVERRSNLLVALGGLLVAILPILILISNYPRLDQSNNFKARDYAQAVLRDNLAKNAVVIAPWEAATPLRYFQFVENQCPDLLIVNVSPIWPQFSALLDRARELNRPFYDVEFDPEFKQGDDYRSVQAVPLPLRETPEPKYRLQNSKTVKEVEVIGYDLDPDPPLPGQPARVLIYYRALERMYPMYASLLGLNDILGRPLEDFPSFPSSLFYPTYRWQVGDVYRDAYSFVLPPETRVGLYTLDLNWYPYDLESRSTDYAHEFRVSLGTIHVGDFSAPQPVARALNARVGEAFSFIGWDSQPAANSDSIGLARGDSLKLDLFWRADHETRESYTVFVHLLNEQGQLVADADSPPFSGLYSTDRWSAGESLRDRHVLAIPGTIAAGKYVIEVGMYLAPDGNRLAVESSSGRTDRIIVAQVNVR
jgi:transmembrane protein TMEM260 (protein O-mannosyltransferase)